jgi:Na+/H+ antiporter NhaA
VARLRHVTRFSSLVISAALKFILLFLNSDNVITIDTYEICGIMLYCISLCLTFVRASGIRSW